MSNWRRLATLIFCVSVLHAADQQQSAKVTVQQLINSPAEYDGKSVEVRGFLLQEFENSALYSSQEWRYARHAIWVIPTADMTKKRDKLNRHYVLITGIFDARSHGHMGQFKGTLTVKTLELVQDGASATSAKEGPN